MWILPTLNRIDKLRTLLESAVAAETSTEGMIVVDEKDWEVNKNRYLDELPKIDGWGFEVTKAVSMGDKCREVWPNLNSNDWVGILNDDHFIQTKSWDMKLIAKLDGKNFVSANDRWIAPRKATTATVWSLPLLNAVGWPIYPPGLQHLFIDDVWETLGKHTGCWRVAMDVVVEHHHVINGKGKMDATHEKVYNQKAWDMDNAIYQNFLKHDLAEAVKKIQALQDQLPMKAYTPTVFKEQK